MSSDNEICACHACNGDVAMSATIKGEHADGKKTVTTFFCPTCIAAAKCSACEKSLGKTPHFIRRDDQFFCDECASAKTLKTFGRNDLGRISVVREM
jgi:hypothetical protein